MNTLFEITHGQGKIRALACDGPRLLAGFGDEVTLWSTRDGTLVRALGRHDSFVLGVALSGARAASAAGHGAADVRVWDLDAGTMSWRGVHDGGVRAVAFSSDSAMLASASEDGAVRVWDVASGHLLSTLSSEPAGLALVSVAFSPDGKCVTAGSDGLEGYHAALWDLDSGRLVDRVKHKSAVRFVRLTHDEWLSAGCAKNIELISHALGTKRKDHKVVLKGHPRPVMCLALSADGTTAASGSTYNDPVGLRVWSTADGVERQNTGAAGEITGVAFAPDGRHVAYNLSSVVRFAAL